MREPVEPTGARRFFKRVLKNPQVIKLIEELGDVTQIWRTQRSTDGREALEQMNKMKTPQFAPRESVKLMEILEE